jgi:hypothetical protein
MYAHPILVPGAVGHDDPEALRQALCDYATAHTLNADDVEGMADIATICSSDLDELADELTTDAQGMCADDLSNYAERLYAVAGHILQAATLYDTLIRTAR